VSVKGVPPGPKTASEEAARALREEFIRDFRAKTLAIASDFRYKLLANPGTIGAAMSLLFPTQDGRLYRAPRSDNAVLLRSRCWECLRLWCDGFPHQLKAFAKGLCEIGVGLDGVEKELEDSCIVIRDVESRNWLACFSGDGHPASEDWRAPGWLLDWPAELKDDVILSAGLNARLNDKQTKEVCMAIQNAISEELLLARGEALNHALIQIAKANNGTGREKERSLEDCIQGSLSKPVDRGKFCCEVIDEIKKIRNFVASTGRSMAEIEKEHPRLAVWKVRATLGPEDQETFNHPNQWGPPVGYAKMVLSKNHGVTTHTITSWVKAYRKTQRSKRARPSR